MDRGVIDPTRLYTTEACSELLCIGPKMLSEARRSGLVNPIRIGRINYYRGYELINWINSHADFQNSEKQPRGLVAINQGA